MRAILYDPLHLRAVTRTRDFIRHLAACPPCRAYHNTDEGQAAWRDLANYMGRELTGEPVTDTADALELCEAWLQAHELMGMLGLDGSPVADNDTRAN